jgi:hypothetical protein
MSGMPLKFSESPLFWVLSTRLEEQHAEDSDAASKRQELIDVLGGHASAHIGR